MGNRDDVLYPVVFEDHDGSWTWSVESGKAFEPGHVIHARGDCCPTRKHAREAAAAAMAAVAGKSGPRPKPSPLPQALNGWAVIANGRVTAIFAERDAAAAMAERDDAQLRAVRCKMDWSLRE